MQSKIYLRANYINAIENGICSNTTNRRLRDLEERQVYLEKEFL